MQFYICIWGLICVWPFECTVLPMTDICLCDKTVTREQIIRNNNLCKCCNKAYRLTIDIDNPEQISKVSEGQEIREDNRIYENTD